MQGLHQIGSGRHFLCMIFDDHARSRMIWQGLGSPWRIRHWPAMISHDLARSWLALEDQALAFHDLARSGKALGSPWRIRHWLAMISHDLARPLARLGGSGIGLP